MVLNLSDSNMVAGLLIAALFLCAVANIIICLTLISRVLRRRIAESRLRDHVFVHITDEAGRVHERLVRVVDVPDQDYPFVGVQLGSVSPLRFDPPQPAAKKQTRNRR